MEIWEDLRLTEIIFAAELRFDLSPAEIKSVSGTPHQSACADSFPSAGEAFWRRWGMDEFDEKQAFSGAPPWEMHKNSAGDH